MNVFTASDVEAADLLAPARHDDGAPPTPLLASDGQGRDAIRLAGTGEGVSRGASLRPEETYDSWLALARERFLTAEPIEPGLVRDTILASWWRCREWHVVADRTDLSYVRDPDRDTPLARSALPVLQNLRENLAGEPVSVVLADRAGVVLSRLTSDHHLERHLDGVQLAPGFSYAEEFVGTNGIGMALESGQAAHVFGHEHYAEQLGDLADAGVPIRHPISGQVIGAVDLTCWRRDAGRLLIALAQSTAGQVTQALLNHSSAREVQLLQEYLRACRHAGGIILAVTSDLVLMNDFARDVLDPGDQAALLGHAAEALAGDLRGPVDVGLPTGPRARMYCRPLRRKGRRRLPGGVVRVKLLEPASGPAAGAGAGPPTRRFGPSLVGSGPLWLRGCDQVDAAYSAGQWLALEGEPGVGKLALLRAVHWRRNPGCLLPARGQRLFQRYPQRLQPRDAEPVDVPEDQATLALEQFAEHPHHPVVITGLGGIQNVERADRVVAPVDGPQQRQLAGPGLARQR